MGYSNHQAGPQRPRTAATRGIPSREPRNTATGPWRSPATARGASPPSWCCPPPKAPRVGIEDPIVVLCARGMSTRDIRANWLTSTGWRSRRRWGRTSRTGGCPASRRGICGRRPRPVGAGRAGHRAGAGPRRRTSYPSIPIPPPDSSSRGIARDRQRGWPAGRGAINRRPAPAERWFGANVFADQRGTWTAGRMKNRAVFPTTFSRVLLSPAPPDLLIARPHPPGGSCPLTREAHSVSTEATYQNDSPTKPRAPDVRGVIPVRYADRSAGRTSKPGPTGAPPVLGSWAFRHACRYPARRRNHSREGSGT